jgi:hypothetical protein
VETGSREENATKQNLEPRFDSIKAGKALAVRRTASLSLAYGPGHPTSCFVWISKTWMPGINPGMTKVVSASPKAVQGGVDS